MKIVALITIRNEELYLDRCLTHLYQEGIEACVIDNGSTDRSLEIAESFRGKNVIRIEHFPFHGSFELKLILQNEERLAGEIKADWFIHHDADEIRQAPAPFSTLAEGISEADKLGYNAINFDEFVFLPAVDESFVGKDYVAEMSHYYFFEPCQNRRVNAWKKGSVPIDLAGSGGHQVEFEGRRIFSENFVMRHYIALSKDHIIAKYAGRVFSAAEIKERGWHGARPSFSPDQLKLPEKKELKTVSTNSNWDKSEPWKEHIFLGHNPVMARKPGIKTKEVEICADKMNPIQKLFGLLNVAKKPKPIPFIVGVMRSGTTLLRFMLDAHPNLAIPPETRFFPEIDSLIEAESITQERFIEFLTTHLTWDDFQIPEQELRRRLKKVSPFTLNKALRCFYETYARRLGKKRWGDKTPYYGLHMDQLQALFPKAHFIHIVRDGRDVALSTRGLWFGLGDSISEEAGNWMNRIRQTRQLAQNCKHYMEVRYEDLVTDSAEVLRQVCEFIDLPYDEQMCEYYKCAEKRLDEMASRYDTDGNIYLHKNQRKTIFQYTKEPPDKGRIGRWKNELSREELKTFKIVAGNLLRDLGYEA